MFDNKTLEDITTHITSMLPTGAVEWQRDVEKNLRAMLTAAFAKLDLVPREEFEVQKELLDRLQDRVATLERQLRRAGTTSSE